MLRSSQVPSGPRDASRVEDDGTPTLVADAVSVRYGGVQAIDRVSFSVHRGEMLGIIGPNGAGKTTLFDAISGHTRVSAGRFLHDGVDITGWSSTRRARAGVRRTFQRPQPFGQLSVEDNVLCASEWRGGGGGLFADMLRLPGRERRERERRDAMRSLIEQAGLRPYARQSAATLPVGVSRLLEVTRALAGQPSLLMMDEPTSGLTDDEAGVLGSLVQTATSRDGVAVLLVEHDIRFVMSCCHRIVVLDLGEVLASGTPADIRQNEAVRAAYLG